MDHDSECNVEQRLGHHVEHDYAANASEYLGQSAEHAVPSSPTSNRRRKRSLDPSSEGEYTLATSDANNNESTRGATMPGAAEKEPSTVHGEESLQDRLSALDRFALCAHARKRRPDVIQIEMEIPSVSSPGRVQVYPLWDGVKRSLPGAGL